MLHGDVLKKFEEIAVLLQNNCFEKLEEKHLKADYEIRSLIIIELQGASLLCYGDKSGSFWIYHREKETNKPIEHSGVIDILDYKTLPGNQALLFAVVSDKGIFIYRLEIIGNEIQCREEGTILETKGCVRFFYPLIVIRPDHSIVRSEVWVGLDNDKSLVLENEGLNKRIWSQANFSLIFEISFWVPFCYNNNRWLLGGNTYQY